MELLKDMYTGNLSGHSTNVTTNTTPITNVNTTITTAAPTTTTTPEARVTLATDPAPVVGGKGKGKAQ